MTEQTVAQLAVDAMIENGIKHLYCLPGVQNDPFFDALYDKTDQLKPIQTRHEQGAVYMALGAALATGKPQTFSIVPGPGFLNGTAALCTAYAVNAPLLALIGQIPSKAIDKGFGLLHEINGQLDILKNLTKQADRVEQGDHAGVKFQETFSALKSGRPRPVGLEVPVNIWQAKTNYQAQLLNMAAQANPAVDRDQLLEATHLIKSAKRPLIVVGGGAQDSSEQVRTLTRLVSAPAIAFRTGHGIVASDDPFSVTTPAGHALWAECDLVIGLGSRLQTQQMQWGVDDALKIIHIDIDDRVLNKINPADVAIHADLADVLPDLNAALADETPKLEWLAKVAETKARFAAKFAEEFPLQLAWLEAIRAELPEEGIFVDELTQIGYVSRFAFPSYKPRTFLSTGYQGTLGWGLATTLGAAHARPDVPVVGIMGDGGAMFAIAELATAAHHNIPATIIIMNDNAFGNVKSLQNKNYNQRNIACELTSPDFVKLAESCGVVGRLANSPEELRVHLREAIASDGPTVIEVPVGEFPSPFDYVLLPKNRGVG